MQAVNGLGFLGDYFLKSRVTPKSREENSRLQLIRNGIPSQLDDKDAGILPRLPSWLEKNIGYADPYLEWSVEPKR